MRELFVDEMKKLHGRFAEMGINVSEQIYRSTTALTDHDEALAKEVTSGDNGTNSEEMELEKQALKLIALQQPVANDFRDIITILKASSDLERIGDHAVTIARETVRVKNGKQISPIEKKISLMSENIRTMLSSVLDAYSKNDDKAARQVAKKDIEIDRLYVEIRDDITKALAKHPEDAQSGSSYLIIIKMLERIGDHIVNLAEWIVYNVTGKIVELNPGKADPELLNNIFSDNLNVVK